MKNKKIILIFMGPPGSGKGTQTDKLAKELKLPAVSPGELLRAEVKNKTALGKKISSTLAKGEFVDNEIVDRLLDKRLLKKDTARGVIFDGFPRSRQQIGYLEKRFLDRADVSFWAVYIDVSDAEAKKRLSWRRVCVCGATYHLAINPPKKKGVCDVCGKKLMQRPDDRPQVVLKRLKIFHRENDPILDYFSKKKLLLKINGEQPIAKIQKDILKILKQKGVK